MNPALSPTELYLQNREITFFARSSTGAFRREPSIIANSRAWCQPVSYNGSPYRSLWMYTMNRCLSATRRLAALGIACLIVLAGALGPGHHARAQTPPARVLPIPATAPLGVLQMLGWPEALLNGQPARMAPGSRIRDPQNLIVPPASLTGLTLQVQYVIDPQGMIREAWILSSDELAALLSAIPVPPLNAP